MNSKNIYIFSKDYDQIFVKAVIKDISSSIYFTKFEISKIILTNDEFN